MRNEVRDAGNGKNCPNAARQPRDNEEHDDEIGKDIKSVSSHCASVLSYTVRRIVDCRYCCCKHFETRREEKERGSFVERGRGENSSNDEIVFLPPASCAIRLALIKKNSQRLSMKIRNHGVSAAVARAQCE